MLSAMSYALDLTEGQPQGHAARSCLFGMRIAEQLRLSADDRSDLFYALLMKDAGCSSNAARVSQLFGGNDQDAKRGLWERDWRNWRKKILARVPAFSEFAYDASCHHERIDGLGYHRGVPGDGLSACARIMATADIFDALSAARPYRGAMPIEQVLKIIGEGRGTQLCPATVDAVFTVAQIAPRESPPRRPALSSNRTLMFLQRPHRTDVAETRSFRLWRRLSSAIWQARLWHHRHGARR